MPHNILMSKIRCYNPNKNHSALKNLNYIMYIATRPGVDLTDVEFDKLTSVIDEEEPETRHSEPSGNDNYIHYIAKRQNSQGLFGNFNFANTTEAAHEVRNVTDMGVNVYRGIVSLSEDDAIELGFDKKEAWVDYMNSVMNDIGNKFGIPVTSLKWCAAVHMEQGHPHCHYTFWRTDGKVMSPYIHTSLQNEIREFLSGEMFKAERELEVTNKTLHRDAILQETHSIMDSLNTHNFHYIPNRITAEQLKNLTNDLIELVKALPGKGRLSYKLIPPDCKALVDKAVDDIINIPAIKKEYAAYSKSVSNISATYSPSTKHDIVNKTIADEDIRKRIANSILKSCRSLSLVQEQFLSGELSSPEHNSFPDDNVNFVDDEPPVISTLQDNIQMNSVHSYDDAYSCLKEKIRDDVFCSDLEWTEEFKNARETLYMLDKNSNDFIYNFEKVLNKLADMHNDGNIPATYLLARIYRSKNYPVYDEEKSQRLYALSYQNFTSALTINKLSANSKTTKFEQIKHNYLNYHLGKMSERGLGCEINFSDAAKYYSACAQTNAYAQYALANIYLGEKTSPLTHDTYIEALSLLHNASSKIPYAAYQYAQNLETPKYSDAAGTADDIYTYYHNALNGFLSQEKEDITLDGNISYKIGKMYYEGKGCEKNDEKAYKYFMKSTEAENKNAYYALGKTCSDKTSPHYDIHRAESYYLKAYEQHQPAYLKNAMAELYSNPEHDLYDIHKAINLYKSCIETDSDAYSMFRLGCIYLFGHGVEKNEAIGLQYLNDAVAHGNEFATQTIEFYNNMTVSAAYSLVYHLFNMFGSRRNQHYLLTNHSAHSNSKDARIDAYRKSQEHSSADFEHD